MQNLSRRGLHSTALETCKLLLALDSADPLGALFLVDYLALRSRQFAWLARFAAKWSPAQDNSADGGGGLEMLPNFAFSLALAAFWREREPSGAAIHAEGRPFGAVVYPRSSAKDAGMRALRVRSSRLLACTPSTSGTPHSRCSAGTVSLALTDCFVHEFCPQNNCIPHHAQARRRLVSARALPRQTALQQTPATRARKTSCAARCCCSRSS